jgi:hypothetical protein
VNVKNAIAANSSVRISGQYVGLTASSRTSSVKVAPPPSSIEPTTR